MFSVQEYVIRDWETLSYSRYARCVEDYYQWKEIGKTDTLERAQAFKDNYIATKTVTTIVHE